MSPGKKATQSDRNKEFCELFDKAKSELGMTQSEFGDLMLVDQPFVSKVLRGDANVTEASLALLKRQLADTHPDRFHFQLPGEPKDTSKDDAEIWKRRAQAAEEKLIQIRERLRSFVDEFSDTTTPRMKTSSASHQEKVRRAEAVSGQIVGDIIDEVKSRKGKGGSPE